MEFGSGGNSTKMGEENLMESFHQTATQDVIGNFVKGLKTVHEGLELQPVDKRVCHDFQSPGQFL